MNKLLKIMGIKPGLYIMLMISKLNLVRVKKKRGKKNKSRNILWFGALLNLSVKNKLGSYFFKLSKKYFPIKNCIKYPTKILLN